MPRLQNPSKLGMKEGMLQSHPRSEKRSHENDEKEIVRRKMETCLTYLLFIRLKRTTNERLSRGRLPGDLTTIVRRNVNVMGNTKYGMTLKASQKIATVKTMGGRAELLTSDVTTAIKS